MTDETIETGALPGERLRKQRERRGLTLAQASSELHIDQRLLTALEDDNYAALGAPIFVKGHLRNYARLLGLDATEMVAQYEASQQPADPTLVAHRVEGVRMDTHRSHAWVSWFGWVFLLLLGVLLAGWWYYQQEGGGDFIISNAPERVTVPEQDQVPSPETAARDSQGSDRQVTAGGESDTPATTGTGTEGAPRADEATDTTPEQNAGSAESSPGAEIVTADRPVQTPPEVATRSTAPVSARGLALEFTQESWVEIYDAEGRPILYDLLGPGTRREINATGQLRVFVGNADGVEVFLGGQPFDLERYRRSDSTARFTINVPAGEQPRQRQ